MKTFNLLVLASLLLINTLFSQEPAELKEAATLTESALKLFEDRKYNDALSKTKKALEIQERLLPRSDMRISISLLYIADIYIVKRDYAAAKKALERLVEIQTERSDPQDASLAPTLDRLAVVYYREGDRRKADELYQRALAWREKAYGVESARVAETLFALAQFYRNERESEPAAKYFARSLKIYGNLLGVSSREFERASDAYSCLSFESGRPELLEELNWIRNHRDNSPTRKAIFQGGVLNGKALSLPKPEYPSGARDRRLSGTVSVKVEIDESGNVINAYDMCQGPPFLSESSVKAALKARFSPTKVAGVPVKVNGIIQYHFVAR